MARLAYNKGTALFRGNNPFAKKCCGNILGDQGHILTDAEHARCGSDGNEDDGATEESTQPERAQFQKQKELYCHQSHA